MPCVYVHWLLAGSEWNTSRENSAEYQGKLNIKTVCEHSQYISGYQPLLYQTIPLANPEMTVV